jgi:hypothetical protein
VRIDQIDYTCLLDEAEINIKAGLKKNKINRWEKFREGNCRDNDLESFVQNFVTRYIMITFHCMAAAGPNFLQKAKV